ncbi:uncharacterized protein EI97DRAFT_432899 [Westerdykella ornata]|uniref:DnaJ homologue subfamily C member 28 conserved domain-containing protein n=1 Tax=Westerdykella ornata TaxID=318751 RepID=A0A6A6JK72_WESOR|nr:uncharacterized protein EI97DRAFT_432899 [Westerdykella ornata]KAF2276654.1 hypothetical protein EI97DRAFT_432899 [Westerdykella ornata]
MPASLPTAPYICSCFLRVSPRIGASSVELAIRRNGFLRKYADSAPRLREDHDAYEKHTDNREDKEDEIEETKQDKDEGAMTRRLRDMSEEALLSGGRSSQKAVSEAGFSEELRKQLEERIASAQFRAEHRSAFTEAQLPSHAGQGTRDIATADPWVGEESIHDASLRMLNDAHKPLRSGRGPRIPGPAAAPPRSIDTGRRSKAGSGIRLANARDRSGIYSSLKDSDIDAAEREKRFQELKDRYSPEARSVVPGTVQGLANLANQRIEDAIARGQFKNLPRGKKIERDYNASNPFIDTTEYFMNKMIQKQEIVPPWIEKQQELVAAASKFRSRLRSDWRRHAARVIASKGGTLQEQMQRAEAYAKAELTVNPLRTKEDTPNTLDDYDHISQISLAGELKIQDLSDDERVTEEMVPQKSTIRVQDAPGTTNSTAADAPPSSNAQTTEIPVRTATSTVAPARQPFRDPAWEALESAYHNVAIKELNTLTRSYNLQAPDLAKKPYFSLARELNACYADVAPQLAEAIRDRATRPKKTEGFATSLGGGAAPGVMDRLVGEKVRVSDEKVERRYGFRQFWRDVWGDSGKT